MSRNDGYNDDYYVSSTGVVTRFESDYDNGYDQENDYYVSSTGVVTRFESDLGGVVARGYSDEKYQFEIKGNTVTSVAKLENGYLDYNQMDLNESYSFDGAYVIKTELERFGVETTRYHDVDRDGIYAKLDHSYSSNLTGNSGASYTQKYHDWYEYSGSRSDYDISLAPQAIKIEDLASNSVVDTLDSADRLIFDDLVVASQSDQNATQAYRIYKAAFDREPDQDGLGYWVNQLDNGMHLEEVASGFINSDEFKSLYGDAPTNSEFLDKVYKNVLGREPDDSGFDWWLSQMEGASGKTWEKVLADFSESDENKANVEHLIEDGIEFSHYGIDFGAEVNSKLTVANESEYEVDLIGQAHDPIADYMWFV